jgi:hypothetical protein
MRRVIQPALQRGRTADRIANLLFLGFWLILLAALAGGIGSLRS